MAAETLASAKGQVLSVSTRLRYITFVVLYFSQGIPEGITIFAIPAWMAKNGISAAEIAGYSAIIIIPFTLKILLAPMMERYTWLPMGKRRPWLLFGQFGIMCSLAAFSFVPEPLHHISLMTAVAICVHLFIMFQDIATDSLVIDIVPIEQQGKANSYMWGSKTIGTSVSIFAGSLLINQAGFPVALLTMSAAVFCIMFVPVLLRERPGEKLLPWSAGRTSPDAALLVIDSWGKLFKSFKQVILLRNTLLFLCMVFITLAAIHFVRTLLPIFTIKELGWNNVYYSKIYSTSNLIGGVVGMIIGSVMIQRFGVMALLKGSICVAAMVVAGMGLSKLFWGHNNLIIAFIGVYCTLITLITIGLLALAMQMCWKRVSAIQFTFCMTIFNAGLAAGAALLGFLQRFLSWPLLFMSFAVLAVIALVLLMFLQVNNHMQKVSGLEADYQEKLMAKRAGEMAVA